MKMLTGMSRRVVLAVMAVALMVPAGDHEASNRVRDI